MVDVIPSAGADRLRELREAGDVTRRELATAAGVSPSQVAKIENGGDTRAETVVLVAGALAVLVPDLEVDAAAIVEACGDQVSPPYDADRFAERLAKWRAAAAPAEAARLRDKRQLLDRFRDPEQREAAIEELVERVGADPRGDRLRRVADQLDPPSSPGTAG